MDSKAETSYVPTREACLPVAKEEPVAEVSTNPIEISSYTFSKKYSEIRNDLLVLEYLGNNVFMDEVGRKYVYEQDEGEKLYLLDEITGEKLHLVN